MIDLYDWKSIALWIFSLKTLYGYVIGASLRQLSIEMSTHSHKNIDLFWQISIDKNQRNISSHFCAFYLHFSQSFNCYAITKENFFFSCFWQKKIMYLCGIRGWPKCSIAIEEKTFSLKFYSLHNYIFEIFVISKIKWLKGRNFLY